MKYNIRPHHSFYYHCADIVTALNLFVIWRHDAQAWVWGRAGSAQHSAGAPRPSQQVPVEEAGAGHEVHQHQQAERGEQQEGYDFDSFF